MKELNKNFKLNNCNVKIKFVKADKYGVDRHLILIQKPMCQSLKEYTFKKTENDIIEYAKQLTSFITTTC